MTTALLWVRGTTAIVVAVLGLLAVFRVPHGFLWLPAVAATSFGVWILPIGLFAAGTGRDWITAVALVGTLMVATPMLRAIPASATLSQRVQDAFGDQPWTANGLPVRSRPYAPWVVTHPAGGPTPEVRTVDGRRLDWYAPAGPGPHPVVVAIHGGSWQRGTPDQLPHVYPYLAARGIAVAAISYRLAPDHTFPTQPDDVVAAIRWLRDNADALGIDDRIVLLGRSAGGHLALQVGYTHPELPIRGVVALYAPSDMNWSWEHPTSPWVLDTPGTLAAFLGGPRDAVPDAYDAASPVRFVGPDTPPTLLLHGGRDELVFAEQSRRLAAALAEAGVPHALVETPWDTHGFEANLGGPGGQIYVWALERFLGSVLTDRLP